MTNINYPISRKTNQSDEEVGLRETLQELRTALQEIHSAGRELKELLYYIQDSRDIVKTLNRPVPVCYACKKVRDDRGHWEHFEAYFARSVGIEAESCVCPECLQGRFGIVDSTHAAAG